MSDELNKWMWIVLIPIILLIIYKLVTSYKTDGDIPKKSWLFRRATGFFAWWKVLLPDGYREFLNKYDSDEPVGKTYPKLMLGAYVLLDTIVALIFLRWIHFMAPNTLGGAHSPFVVVMDHIDVAGLINGALGIIFAVIIARIVEDENKEEKKELKYSTEKIRTATIEIQDVTTKLDKNVDDILNRFTALIPQNTFRGRLKAYKEIIKMADIYNNELYIMNHSGDLGFLRSKNLGILLEHISYDQQVEKMPELRNIYYDYERDINEITDSLHKLCETKKHQVNLAFLNISATNRDRKSAYEKYIDRTLTNASVVSSGQFEKLSDDSAKKSVQQTLEAIREFRKACYVDFDLDNTSSIKFKESVVSKNTYSINELQKRVPINLIDRIPFQFIVTKPQTENGDIHNQSCLIIFSNVDAIGDNAGVYAFQSSDTGVIRNLVEIFNTYLAQQKERTKKNRELDKAWEDFNEFFDLGRGRSIYTVLKFKPLEEETPELLNAISLSDFEASLNLQQLFEREHEPIPISKHHSHTDETGRRTNAEFTEAFFEQATYFAVGLFGENNMPHTLAEYIITRSAGAMIKLKRGPRAKGEVNKLIVNNNEYEGVWKQHKDNKRDFALITKIKTVIDSKQITVFVLGGINHYGTECIGNYFRQHWRELHLRANKQTFAAVYEINNDDVEEKAFVPLVLLKQHPE
jgi:hypothetical protein